MFRYKKLKKHKKSISALIKTRNRLRKKVKKLELLVSRDEELLKDKKVTKEAFYRVLNRISQRESKIYELRALLDENNYNIRFQLCKKVTDI